MPKTLIIGAVQAITPCAPHDYLFQVKSKTTVPLSQHCYCILFGALLWNAVEQLGLSVHRFPDCCLLTPVMSPKNRKGKLGGLLQAFVAVFTGDSPDCTVCACVESTCLSSILTL